MRNADDRTPLPGHGRLRNALARLLVRVQDMEFTVSNTRAQPHRLGGAGRQRPVHPSAALDRIAAAERHPWQRGALLEEYELGLHMILSDYQVRHIADTWVSQEGLPRLRRLLSQRTRWAQGNLQCVRYAPRVIAPATTGGAASWRPSTRSSSRSRTWCHWSSQVFCSVCSWRTRTAARCWNRQPSYLCRRGSPSCRSAHSSSGGRSTGVCVPPAGPG
ncbi:glycosyltransferase [Streptomyces chrestomyceticus]